MTFCYWTETFTYCIIESADWFCEQKLNDEVQIDVEIDLSRTINEIRDGTVCIRKPQLVRRIARLVFQIVAKFPQIVDKFNCSL